MTGALLALNSGVTCNVQLAILQRNLFSLRNRISTLRIRTLDSLDASLWVLPPLISHFGSLSLTPHRAEDPCKKDLIGGRLHSHSLKRQSNQRNLFLCVWMRMPLLEHVMADGYSLKVLLLPQGQVFCGTSWITLTCVHLPRHTNMLETQPHGNPQMVFPDTSLITFLVPSILFEAVAHSQLLEQFDLGNTVLDHTPIALELTWDKND